MGPRTNQHEIVTSEVAGAAIPAANPNGINGADACNVHAKAFQDENDDADGKSDDWMLSVIQSLRKALSMLASQKSMKKSGAGSASKLKKLDDLAPTVALPAANEGEAIISVDAIVTGEAMAGEIGAPTSISESESLRKQNTVANSSGNLKEMENSKSDCCVLDAAGSEVFAKPISINRKVLKNAQNLKTAVPSVSLAGMDIGVKNNSGTINVEVVNAGNSSLEKLPAGVNATNPISGDVFAGFCSPNTQNICINSKVHSVAPLVESVAVPSSFLADGKPKAGIDTAKAMVDIVKLPLLSL